MSNKIKVCVSCTILVHQAICEAVVALNDERYELVIDVTTADLLVTNNREDAEHFAGRDKKSLYLTDHNYKKSMPLGMQQLQWKGPSVTAVEFRDNILNRIHLQS